MTGLGPRAFPVVLAAPSGTGKTTIAHRLVEGSGEFTFSVSATTRPPRPGERNGMDYEFVSREAFDALLAADELCEWAEVHGHLYGTPRSNIVAAGERGEHVVLDIDVKGARQIRRAVPDAVLIFVFPPSAEALVARLKGRATENTGELERRLRNAHAELEAAADFDYVVVNDDLDETVREVREIVRAERHRPGRAFDLDADVGRLRTEIAGILSRDFSGVP